MALPSGYTQLKYIQSSGTQYINTRFNPSGNALRVVMKFRYTAAYSGLSLFGNHTSTPYSLTVYGTRPTFWVGNSSDVSCGPQTEQGVDYTLDATAENGTITAYWNGVKYTASYSGSLYTEQPIFIFGGNSNGALAEAGNGYQLEMFQLYDGGALVRDYVPAKSSAGVVGLYDNVEGVFETNAGSGAFAEGPLASGPVEGTGASLVDGVSFGINDGKCMVGGTGYSISKGRTLVGGTGYDIAFAKPFLLTVKVGTKVNSTRQHVEIDGEFTVISNNKSSANIGDDYDGGNQIPPDGLTSAIIVAEVQPGATVTAILEQYSMFTKEKITLNGVVVEDGTSFPVSYSMQPVSDVTIEFSTSGTRYQTITITGGI